MISLDPATAILLYLSLTVGIVFGLWITYHLRSKKKIIFSNREELYICEYCHCVYVSDPLKQVTQCPECRTYNKNNRFPSK